MPKPKSSRLERTRAKRCVAQTTPLAKVINHNTKNGTETVKDGRGKGSKKLGRQGHKKKSD
eukprot:2123177-Amphidinium_carterae.3